MVERLTVNQNTEVQFLPFPLEWFCFSEPVLYIVEVEAISRLLDTVKAGRMWGARYSHMSTFSECSSVW